MRSIRKRVSGLSLAAAYVAAECKQAGANANAARLMRNDSVSSRVAALRNELSATVAATCTLNSVSSGEKIL
jgi:hypothetical protein